MVCLFGKGDPPFLYDFPTPLFLLVFLFLFLPFPLSLTYRGHGLESERNKSSSVKSCINKKLFVSENESFALFYHGSNFFKNLEL